MTSEIKGHLKTVDSCLYPYQAGRSYELTN